MRRVASISHGEAVTSLGESAAETALLLRAGLNNVAASRFIDADGERILLCAAPALPSDLPAADRLVALAAHALTGVWQALEVDRETARNDAKPIVVIALPERFAVHPLQPHLNVAGIGFVDALRAGLPPGLAGAAIEAMPYGRAGGALAMRRALQWADADRLVLWGGVDTSLDWAVLEALEAADRLVTVDNIDGVRPGEAAAFARVSSDPDDASVGLLALGLGREPCPIGSEEPSFARGLTQALDDAVAPLRASARRTDQWWLDLTHEAYATEALQNVIARFGDVLGLDSDLQTPLKELGDVGAASMPLLAILAGEAWRLGHAADDTAVVTGCSDNGARGAFLIGAPKGWTR